MAIQRSVLLIADIGGYTRFMKEHRFALAHAQEAIAALLEAVLDGAKPLKLAKLEGDAAFLYAPAEKEQQLTALGEAIARIRGAFLERQRSMAVNRLCDCKGCVEVDLLRLKFVAHVGEVAFQKVKRNVELAGVDVILVHRMLKNDVPLSEYALVSEAALAGFDPALRERAQFIEHDFEGLGRTPTHYLDLSHLPPPAEPARKSLAARWLDRLVLTWKSLPYWLGVKRACATFHNVEGEIVVKALPPPESGARPR